MEQIELMTEDVIEEETPKHRQRPPHVEAAVERVRRAREELKRAQSVVRALGMRGLTSPARTRKQKAASEKREEAKRLKRERDAEAKRMAVQGLAAVLKKMAASEMEEAKRRSEIDEILAPYYADLTLRDARAHAFRNLAGASHE